MITKEQEKAKWEDRKHIKHSVNHKPIPQDDLIGNKEKHKIWDLKWKRKKEIRAAKKGSRLTPKKLLI